MFLVWETAKGRDRKKKKKKKRSIDFSLTCREGRREGEWREGEWKGRGEKRDAMTNRENWRA